MAAYDLLLDLAKKAFPPIGLPRGMREQRRFSVGSSRRETSSKSGTRARPIQEKAIRSCWKVFQPPDRFRQKGGGYHELLADRGSISGPGNRRDQHAIPLRRVFFQSRGASSPSSDLDPILAGRPFSVSNLCTATLGVSSTSKEKMSGRA